MANPNLLWVRDAVSITADCAGGNTYWVDLLWKPRTGNNVQGSDQAFVTAHGDVNPQAIFTDDFSKQDISGALVKRIILHYVCAFAPIPPLILTDQANLNRWCGAGVYEGLEVEIAGSNGYGVINSAPGPGNQQSSVTHDWLWWNRPYLATMATPAGGTPFPAPDSTPSDLFTGMNVMGRTIDTRCSRRLQEWDSTLRFYLMPNEVETLNQLNASWSVLLDVPQ